MVRSIIVTAPSPRGAALARDLRQWVFEFRNRTSPKPTVREADTLAAVVRVLIQEQDPPPIIVAAGVTCQALRRQLPAKNWPLCLLVGSRAPNCEPLATPMLTEPSTVRSPQRRHLEKLTALQSVISWLSIRRLTTNEEIQSYLSLRYRVWTQLGYLSEDRRCDVAQVEVDYSDRFSTALGAFASVDGKEKLVGCVRVVHEKVDDNSQWKLIENLLLTKRDPNLQKSIQPTRQNAYPFDLLASFPTFADTYRKWVRAGRLKAELSRVVVHPDWRCKGVGEVLVDSAIVYARQQGLDLLFLACTQEHAPFYQHSGFQALPGLTCESFAAVRVPAVGMLLDL